MVFSPKYNSAVVRSDSVYKADLCNLCDFTFLQPGELDYYHVLILRDGGGKSVKDKIHFGKVMRHKILELYPIGALDLWLLDRVHVTKEPEDFDY